MRHDPKRTGGKHIEYDRYGKSAFDAHGLDSDEARRLCDQLEYDVVLEVTRAASNRLAEIVGELNARGHNLVRYEAAPGDIDYRDEAGADPCALRLGMYLVATAGYAHLIDEHGEPVRAKANWGGQGSPRGNRE